ncbi:MAG: putative O-glycosylation ligase, exosortase A system-associated [Allosphingosinicella sp.]
MRDLAFVGFLLALLAMGFRRPFLFVLAYAYVDIVSPQHLSYFLINSVPLSMIVAGLAFAGFAIADAKTGARFSVRQGLMLLLLGYAAFTTANADFPVEAGEKWDWVWKVLAWSLFLPFVLRTRLRIEAYLLFMVLCASSIVIVGGIKTALSGGGYGVLNLMVSNNSGLYESSTISTVAIAIVPLILWLSRFGTVFPRDWRVRLFAAALIFACLLIPVGTEARTGLVCIAVLAMLMLREVKRRFLYAGMIALATVAVIPFLPDSFSSRMETISGHREDASASTRIAVWKWTWDYAQGNPLGGGFGAYRQNKLQVRTVATREAGSVEVVSEQVMFDKARAYHSSYFEMLGEQGFPGLFLWLLIHGIGLIRMETLRRRYRAEAGDKAWISPLATALQGAQIIYLVGSLFVGLAFQPFVWMLLSVQIAFDLWVTRRARQAAKPPRPFRAAPAAA